jgi:hypothetical protein
MAVRISAARANAKVSAVVVDDTGVTDDLVGFLEQLGRSR